MIESFITQEMILKGEPHLDNYLSDSQLSFDDIAEESFSEYLQDVKNQKFDLRKLGKQLSLQTEVSNTSAYTGTWTTEDYVERRRLVINITAQVGNAVFALQGSDDKTTIYDVKTDIQTAKAGKYNYIFNNVYKYYRLKLISIVTSITYTGYLIETTFDFPIIFLTRAKIYHSLFLRDSSDAFEKKYELYMDKYRNLLTNETNYIYDADDTGDISEDEAEHNIDVSFTL